ncbi:ssDNA binding protein [Cercopithecine alphaherpesvirus 9]|uniref:SsDNA binding protein n=1 Tax=Cercopithecine herpesvirus 9 (strain DHV) TaxID=36348 RepID=Q9E1Y7_CHV9D|nr:single-stranded DNA-binding protein [Cercopithecine alphaherpesvirus 9]AAG27202.1 ssDNA binding protein [Cercopithecine alphaherpesvirus 9]
MEATQKTITVPTGPLGYVYACNKEDLDLPEISLLSARSIDSDLALIPLIRNLTVEKSFTSSLAVVSGTKTTGLAGAGVTLKLITSHYYPTAFVFHGGHHISPSSFSPNLTQACNTARERFGFMNKRGSPVDGAIETTGADICNRIHLNPEHAFLYLIVTSLFKEAVYMCNSFLYYGGIDNVRIGRATVTRIPLFPIHVFMPDVNRLVTDPFNATQRSIGENFVYPTPLFNGNICNLLYDCVISPIAVSLRIRNVVAVARGAAHLAFDENHEGAVLPSDITYTSFQSTSNGSVNPRLPRQNTSKSSQTGFERRLASIMTADTALQAEVIFSSGVYDEAPSDITEWPMLIGTDNVTERLNILGSYVARISGTVAAMVFSPNSVLYLTEIEDGGVSEGKDGGPGPSFNRFYQFAGPHLAANPQVDRDGCVVFSGNTGSVNTEFNVDILALVCGFSPQLLARLLFYLERCDAGTFSGGHSDALQYVMSTFNSDIPCSLCERHTRHLCVHTTIQRLKQRMPRFGPPSRQPIGVFGIMNSQYSDCDPLGNYAPYLILRKPGDQTETAKSTMQDTYRATLERLFSDLEQENLFDRSSPFSSEGLNSTIIDHATFRRALEVFKTRVQQITEQFIKVLVETRDYKIREGLTEATHSLSITADPYSGSICPITYFLVKRTNLAVIQDLILSQCHGVFHGQQVEGRNFRNQFQPVLRRRFIDLFNGGFLSTRPVTVTLPEGPIIAPDPTLGQEAPACTFDGDLTKVSVDVIRDLRVKNRVVFSGSCTNLSEAARARLIGLASAYQRQNKRVDMLHGALGFLLKQFHSVLFPRGIPPNAKSPNPQWFWALLQRNQMPADNLTSEEINTIAIAKRFTEEYEAINFINIAPTCIGELAQFYMANLILKYCDHSQYFINTLTAVITGSKRPHNPSSALHWIDKEITTPTDLETHARLLIRNTEQMSPYMWISSFMSTNLVRAVMNQRPIVVLGISISKYYGAAGNNRVFQAGNWSGLNGGKNVCPLFVIDRTRRFVIACPRGGFVCSIGNTTPGSRENNLSDQVRNVIAAGGALVQIAVYSTVIRALGDRAEHMGFDDWLSLTDDEYLARDLEELHDQINQTLQTPWNSDAVLEALKALNDGATVINENSGCGNIAFNFDTCNDSNTEENHAPPSYQPLCSGVKRPRDDDLLFDMSSLPQKMSLTMDMV